MIEPHNPEIMKQTHPTDTKLRIRHDHEVFAKDNLHHMKKYNRSGTAKMPGVT